MIWNIMQIEKGINMQKNMCPAEQIVRTVGGAYLIVLALNGLHSLWFLLGLIPLATGLAGWCPLYALFGRATSSCSTKK